MAADFTAARNAIDAAHAADPAGAELGYADAVEAWVARLLGSDCGELERLAARCQHLERWVIPRDSQPRDKAGYHRWRRSVQLRQGERAEALLLAAGIAAADASRVRACVAKNAAGDPLAQALEDAACLVFLEHEGPSFLTRYDDAQVLEILRKTARKMSGPALASIATIGLDPRLGRLVAAL